MYGGGTTTPEFQSTLPGWGATFVSRSFSHASIFQSTLPGWGATRRAIRPESDLQISIHAPRMGSDVVGEVAPCGAAQISIHAPRMGSDARRSRRIAGASDFNPRSPDGERRTCVPPSYFDDIFQSTLPGWGATPAVDFIDPLTEISIHAPRMGSDTSSWSMTRSSTYFNPRSPDGERHEATMYPLDSTAFQSTLPGWGATLSTPAKPLRPIFQSTLPGWGATTAHST